MTDFTNKVSIYISAICSNPNVENGDIDILENMTISKPVKPFGLDQSCSTPILLKCSYYLINYAYINGIQVIKPQVLPDQSDQTITMQRSFVI